MNLFFYPNHISCAILIALLVILSVAKDLYKSA